MPARVYLLGGSSSVGKTTAAAAVAERLGAVHLQLDSVARASADPRDHRLGAGVNDLWSLPAAHVCDLLVQKGEALAAPVHALIGRCLSGESVTLVEGEGIHPGLARRHAGDLVRWLLAPAAGPAVRPALGPVQTLGDPARPPDPGLAPADPPQHTAPELPGG